MSGEAWMAFVTGPDRETLAEIGRRAVEERLAACVNLWEGVESIYRWEGSVEEAAEALALFKTTEGRLEELERRVRGLHPYDEPEFVAVPLERGSASYLRWISRSVGGRD